MTAAEFFTANWPYVLVAVAILVAIGWFLMLANRKASVRTDKRDVLDEGAAPAQRNQALIDAGKRAAPEFAATPPTPAGSHADAEADDLTRIKGLGPKIATILNGMGINRFAQIAAWSDADIDRIDANLDKFQGRIRRDNWVEQAKLLSQNDESGFAEKFGQNG